MCGNNIKRYILTLGVTILAVVMSNPDPALPGGRKIPVKNFQLGLDIEPGFKFIGGLGFLGNGGIMLKFKDKFSIIPHFGMFPYTYDKEYTYDDYVYDPLYGWRWIQKTDTQESDDLTINAGVTVRMEFPRKIIIKSTKFEYDVDKHEFQHYYYHSPFRPYVQVHLGTFMGLGGGVLYYFHPAFAVGGGADLGLNLMAEDNKFGIVAPKLVLVTGF
jgi:hypothetical protein